MQKKGVVLFITIFFITAISVIVLKNLDDTKNFVEKQNFTNNHSQILIAMKNTQEQVSKLLVQKQSDIEDYIDKNGEIKAPLVVEDLKISIEFDRNTKTDINDILKDPSPVASMFDTQNIFDFDKFKEIYKEKTNFNETTQKSEFTITTSKQLDDIIQAFLLDSDYQYRKKLEENLGFKASTDLYELYVKIDYNNTFSKGYYILDKTGKVEYFDISFK